MFDSRGRTSGESGKTAALAAELRRQARPLATPSDLDPLIDRIGDARYVLLGEASHGTSEYYSWRAELSKRLIREKGFSFIAVEGDWPDGYRVNRYVKHYADSGVNATDVLHAFERWPTWMWANREIVELVEWLRRYNDQRRLPDDRKVGFYGLDVYSLWDSMRAVVEYLERIDPQLASGARRAYRCFEPYGEDEQEYARATYLVPTSCEDEAVSVLRALRARSPEYAQDGREAYFNAEQNAFVARNAELYYRTMVRGGSQSWNVRDHHMVDTLDRLMAHHRHVMHDAIAADFDAKAALIVFDDADDGGITGLDEPIDHRAIGVVYDPSHERWGNYVPTIVPRRYDAFMFVEETRALSPLHLPVRVGEVPETFPSGE